MDKQFVRRRPSSGPNTGLKRRKSNPGSDDCGSINISNNLPRLKPGISSQALSYRPECGTTTYTTMQGLRQSYESAGATGGLISKTTLDTLRQFKYASSQSPNREELDSGHPNIRHGYPSDTWQRSGNDDKQSTSRNPPLRLEADSGYNHDPPGSLRGTTKNSPVAIKSRMALEANFHEPVQSFSTSDESNMPSPFSSTIPRYYEVTEAPGSEPRSPCSDLVRQNKPGNITSVSQVSEPEGCNLSNPTSGNVQGAPDDVPGFCDDGMDEAGLVALADAYDQPNSGLGRFAVSTTSGTRAIPKSCPVTVKFSEPSNGTASSCRRHPESIDEYGMDSEFFNYTAEAVLDDRYSNIRPEDLLPAWECNDNGKAPSSQLQNELLEGMVAQSPPSQRFLANNNPKSATRALSPYHPSYQEPILTNPLPIEGDSCSNSLHGNQDQRAVNTNAQLRSLTSQKATSGSQFIPTGSSVEIQSPTATNSCPAQPSLRHTFPSPVRNRSHIQGLSPHTVLRTCFRIAEALKAAFPSHPPTHGAAVPRTTLIELYAIVTASYRWSNMQFFTFADLFFPDRPPHLGGKWVGGTLDSAVLTRRQNDRNAKEDDIGSLCRVLGTISTAGKGNMDGSPNGSNLAAPLMKDMKMMVLGIWQVDWDHVEYARGIVEA